MKNESFAFLAIFSILALLVFVSPAFTAEPNITLKSGHIPTYHGIKTVWYSNNGNVPVSLSFSAPWDLTSGPKQRRIKENFVEKSDAFNEDKFPEATFAIERISGGQKEYEFRKKIKNGVYWYGSSSPPENPDISNFSFSPAIRLLLLPAKVGLQVEQHVTVVSPEGNAPATIFSKVVGKGKVIVGAGTFNDGVMFQHKVQITGEPPFILYDWYVPFVGLVATIQSLDNETNELFTTASVFRWMKSCTMP